MLACLRLRIKYGTKQSALEQASRETVQIIKNQLKFPKFQHDRLSTAMSQSKDAKPDRGSDRDSEAGAAMAGILRTIARARPFLLQRLVDFVNQLFQNNRISIH